MLKFLGRGSGFSRENTSAFYEFDNSLLLIDCGYTVFNKCMEKLNFSKYDNIYIAITHLHPDHTGSLGQLILYLGYALSKTTTIVTKCEKIQDFLDISGVNREFYQISDGKEIGITFIKTTHINLLDSYGFVFKNEGQTIIYTGDASSLNPFEKYLDIADELYVEVSKNGIVHIQIDEILPKLLEIQRKGTKIYLMHLDDEIYIANATKGKLEFANLV